MRDRSRVISRQKQLLPFLHLWGGLSSRTLNLLIHHWCLPWLFSSLNALSVGEEKNSPLWGRPFWVISSITLWTTQMDQLRKLKISGQCLSGTPSHARSPNITEPFWVNPTVDNINKRVSCMPSLRRNEGGSLYLPSIKCQVPGM